MITTRAFKPEAVTYRVYRVWLPGEVFAYIIEGSEKALLVDTGCGLGPLRRFVEERLEGKPYELVLTHGHLDHAGGAAEFDHAWLHPRDFEMASRHSPKEGRAAYIRRFDDIEFDDSEMMEPRAPGDFLPLEYGQTFDLGDETVEVVCLGGHSPGSIGLLLRNERILISGDACCSITLMFGGPGSLGISDYRNNLIRTWEKYQGTFDTVLYSHPHNFGGPEVIPQMIELTGEILAGTDDHIESVNGMGRVSYLAKAMDSKSRRYDHKVANLEYAPDSVR